MSNEQDRLLKNDDDEISNSISTKNDILHSSEEAINRICESVNKPDYDPKETIRLIKEYNDSNETLDRILYSQISVCIFSFSDEDCDTYTSNLRTFIEEALNEEKDPSILKIFIRFFDHSELALRQRNVLRFERIEEMYNSLSKLEETLDKSRKQRETEYKSIDAKIESSRKKIKKTEKEVNESIKNTLRDYISIFGVFSAIIITFVGGLSFTSSVLESMAIVSKYRLIFVICLLSFTVFNVIYYLMEVILRISKITIKKEVYCCITKRKLNIPTLFNMTIVIILSLDAVFWLISKW